MRSGRRLCALFAALFLLAGTAAPSAWASAPEGPPRTTLAVPAPQAALAAAATFAATPTTAGAQNPTLTATLDLGRALGRAELALILPTEWRGARAFTVPTDLAAAAATIDGVTASRVAVRPIDLVPPPGPPPPTRPQAVPPGSAAPLPGALRVPDLSLGPGTEAAVGILVTPAPGRRSGKDRTEGTDGTGRTVTLVLSGVTGLGNPLLPGAYPVAVALLGEGRPQVALTQATIGSAAPPPPPPVGPCGLSAVLCGGPAAASYVQTLAGTLDVATAHPTQVAVIGRVVSVSPGQGAVVLKPAPFSATGGSFLHAYPAVSGSAGDLTVQVSRRAAINVRGGLRALTVGTTVIAGGRLSAGGGLIADFLGPLSDAVSAAPAASSQRAPGIPLQVGAVRDAGSSIQASVALPAGAGDPSAPPQTVTFQGSNGGAGVNWSSPQIPVLSIPWACGVFQFGNLSVDAQLQTRASAAQAWSWPMQLTVGSPYPLVDGQPGTVAINFAPQAPGAGGNSFMASTALGLGVEFFVNVCGSSYTLWGGSWGPTWRNATAQPAPLPGQSENVPATQCPSISVGIPYTSAQMGVSLCTAVTLEGDYLAGMAAAPGFNSTPILLDGSHPATLTGTPSGTSVAVGLSDLSYRPGWSDGLDLTVSVGGSTVYTSPALTFPNCGNLNNCADFAGDWGIFHAGYWGHLSSKMGYAALQRTLGAFNGGSLGASVCSSHTAGINDPFGTADQVAAAAADLGCKYLRIDLGYGAIFDSNHQLKQADLAAYTQFVKAAAAHGAGVIPVLLAGPLVTDQQCCWVENFDVADWQAFVSTVATAFGSSVRYYQVLNEENDFMTQSMRVPGDVVTAFQTARAAIRAANPQAEVIANALADGVVGGPSGAQAIAWLSALAAASGAVDVAALDHYPTVWNTPYCTDTWNSLQALFAAVNDPASPLYGKQTAIMETGYPTSGSFLEFVPFAACPVLPLELTQAAYIDTILPDVQGLISAQNQQHPGAGRFLFMGWYELMDNQAALNTGSPSPDSPSFSLPTFSMSASASPASASEGAPVTVSASLQLPGGASAAGGVVTFSAAGQTTTCTVTGTGCSGSITAPTSPGPVTVNAAFGGTSTVPPMTASASFTVVSAPAITAVNPASGSAGGGQTVTVTGSQFLPGATVDFGAGNPAGGVSVNAAGTAITLTTPPAPPGLSLPAVVDVTVTNPDGGTATDPGAFDYYRVGTYMQVTASHPTLGDEFRCSHVNEPNGQEAKFCHWIATSATTQVTATLLNNGLPDAGQTISFSSSPAAGAGFSPATCTTGSGGSCSVDFTASAAGSYTLTASGAGASASTRVGYTQISGPAAILFTMSVPRTGQTVTLTGSVTLIDGAPDGGAPVLLTASAGTISPTSTRTAGDGSFSATYTAPGLVEQVTVMTSTSNGVYLSFTFST